MKKRNSVIAILMALTMTFGVAASASAESSDDETYVLKIAVAETQEEATGQQLATLGEKIEEYTDGKVTVENYYSSELGSDSDVEEMVASGSNIMNFVSMDFYGNYDYDIQILDGPFFFYDPEEMSTLQDSDWWDEQMDVLAESNIELLGTMYFGARSVIHKVGPDASSPEDFWGVCMRSADTPMRYAMCEAITGNVTTLAWSEIYTALSTGVADMCEAPLATVVGSAIYEVCPYITLDEHIHAFLGASVSKDWYDALPTDIQDGIQKAVDEVCADSIEFVKNDEEETKEFLESEGVTFVDVDDKTEWAEVTKSAYDALDFTEGTYDRCMEILGH